MAVIDLIPTNDPAFYRDPGSGAIVAQDASGLRNARKSRTAAKRRIQQTNHQIGDLTSRVEELERRLEIFENILSSIDAKIRV